MSRPRLYVKLSIRVSGDNKSLAKTLPPPKKSNAFKLTEGLETGKVDIVRRYALALYQNRKSFRFPVVFSAHIHDTNNEKLHCKTSRGGEGRTRPLNNRMGHGKKFFGETKRRGEIQKSFIPRSSFFGCSVARPWLGTDNSENSNYSSPSLPDPSKLCSFCREWSRSKKGFISLGFASYFQEKVGKGDLFKQKLF